MYFRKAKKEYEEYCAPLLHLSGVCVSLLLTSGESDATELVKKIPENPDAIVVAGGDGTVSEVYKLRILTHFMICKMYRFAILQVVTGLLRLKDEGLLPKLLPIGILPLGETNSLAKQLYAADTLPTDRLFRYHVMMEAAYSIIREITKNVSAVKITNVELDNVKFYF